METKVSFSNDYLSLRLSVLFISTHLNTRLYHSAIHRNQRAASLSRRHPRDILACLRAPRPLLPPTFFLWAVFSRVYRLRHLFCCNYYLSLHEFFKALLNPRLLYMHMCYETGCHFSAIFLIRQWVCVCLVSFCYIYSPIILYVSGKIMFCLTSEGKLAILFWSTEIIFCIGKIMIRSSSKVLIADTNINICVRLRFKQKLYSKGVIRLIPLNIITF